ncbi:MAG: UDP-3-O-(3-hydroxymyristoyl)glucosamine N-acyltransferase [Pseudomonadales bacterium]
MTITLHDICTAVNGELHGSAEKIVTSIAPLGSAEPNQLTFLSDSKYRTHLAHCRAGAVLLKAEFVGDLPSSGTVSSIVVSNPYLAYAQASSLFDDRPESQAGVHPTAVIGSNVQLGDDVAIGPHCVLGNNVVVGAGSSLGAGCSLANNVVLGINCRLDPQVVIYHQVSIGDRVHLHSHCVIGADGFGYAPSPSGWQKIVQLGAVKIGNDVSVGASTTIDRGAISDTVIEDGVIIDNQVQIAHNVVIGKNTALAGCVGIAGSAKIGANCTLGGGVGVAGHLSICDGVHLTGMTLVSKSISEPGVYSSGTALSRSDVWRKNAVRFLQLDKLHKRVVALEKHVNKSN